MADFQWRQFEDQQQIPPAVEFVGRELQQIISILAEQDGGFVIDTGRPQRSGLRQTDSQCRQIGLQRIFYCNLPGAGR